ncbi:hypothetical protein [Peptoniphilus indolicus]|uniref:Uncharacterized protein n=2 Tax=Peptoniphilus indolicus TaxID=33030 RepID=G4D3Q2_9FIRM|nr:hypothetical protein [Peptoniphilus indolicus]EGY79850.1 hypothetical protein HMPREF9129_1032 [Peptoniphilus indolicus ATCC 29427]
MLERGFKGMFLLSLGCFKRSKGLVTKPSSMLSSMQASEVSLMLGLSEDLRLAYQLKELF